MNAIQHSAVFDTKLLLSIKELVVAGLRSRHKAIVNESIVLWNSTFGEEGTVEYPEDLKTVLRKLRPMTDISLRDLPESDGEEVSGLRSAAHNRIADVPRPRFRLCISLTLKMKQKRNRSLSSLLLDLLHQFVHYNALLKPSNVCQSVRNLKKLLRSEVHQVQHGGRSRLLQGRAYDTTIPKFNSLPSNLHLFSLNQLSHNF